jgi:hypothetical protein
VKKISYKSGVKLNGIQPEMVAALPVIASCYHHMGYDCIFTSVCDGVHSTRSLHYAGLAVDCRTRHMTAGTVPDVAKLISERLGSDFDVVIESDHVHVEFDPD